MGLLAAIMPVFDHHHGYQFWLCGIFRDGARCGIIQENKLHTPGDPLLKMNPILATEFLASQMERVREVTSWSGTVWGEHRSVATCPDRPRYSRTPRTCHQRDAKSKFLSTLPACRLAECPDRSGPDTPRCAFLAQSHASPPHRLLRPEAQL